MGSTQEASYAMTLCAILSPITTRAFHWATIESWGNFRVHYTMTLRGGRRTGGGGGGDDAMFTGRFGLGYDMEMGTHVLVRIAYKERNL